MPEFFSNANIFDIGQNLLVLSLDALKPMLGQFNAPSLTEADYAALRKWTTHWPTLDLFPYSEGIGFGDTLKTLHELLPAGRGSTLLRWALYSTPLTDPALGQRHNRPGNAALAWRDALTSARDLNCLAALELSAAGEAALLGLLKQFDETMIPAETLSKSLAKEWDPYPVDPQQFTYNMQVKSPWDRHIYETYCQSMSFHLSFDVVFILRDQETHRFVRQYVAQIPSSDHAKISTLLPLALEGQGHYALHPWQLDRLREYADLPIESLLPYTRDAH
jgi:hypothetical protein